MSDRDEMIEEFVSTVASHADWRLVSFHGPAWMHWQHVRMRASVRISWPTPWIGEGAAELLLCIQGRSARRVADLAEAARLARDLPSLESSVPDKEVAR